MKKEIYKLFDAIFSNGLDNSCVGMCRGSVDTRSYFGCYEDMKLEGQFLYIYRTDDDLLVYGLDDITPFVVLTMEEQKIYLYYLGGDE